MLPDRVSNPGPLTYESGALPIALRGPFGLVLEPETQLFFFFTLTAKIDGRELPSVF